MVWNETRRIVRLIPLALLATGCEILPQSSDDRADWSIVRMSDDFEFDAPGDTWTFRTPVLWRVTTEGERRFLQMAIPPDRPVLPGIRRPQEYAVHNRFEFRSFSLACYVRIDRDPQVQGRDTCIIFGRQDNTHFYYAHLSNVSDALHNNVIRVDGETRQSLLSADAQRPPAITDSLWHRVDLVRDVDTGTIRLWVDLDLDRPDEPPLFEVTDRTYDWGFVGLGSFDDHASFGRFGIGGQARQPLKPLVTDVGEVRSEK